MKLSEIFRRASSREEPSSESQPVAFQEENFAELPPFKPASEELSADSDAKLIPFEPPRVPLPESYFYPNAKEAADLHAELLRELPADHALFGVPLETFAACHANDDTLFRFRGNPRRFVLVHLTWLGRTEINANHPSIVLSGSFDDFLNYATEVHRLISKRDSTK